MGDLTCPRCGEMVVALKRLILHASEFQKWAQNFDETDTTDRYLTVSLQLAQEALTALRGTPKG